MNYLKTLIDLYRYKNNVNKTKKQITKLQDKKLRKILYYAYDHSKYYHDTFEKEGITRDKIKNLPISKFPSINKAKLIKNFNDLITVSDLTQEELRIFDENETINQKIFKNKYHVIHSSGSTGQPRYFIYDKNAWNTILIGIIRAALWNMSMKEIIKFLLSVPRVLYIAATDGRYAGAIAVGDGIDEVGAKQLFLDINIPLEEWIKNIKEFKPNMIIGYPSAIKILAELVQKGEIKLDVFRVISCGEPLDNNLRKYLENTLKATVINFYGASESLPLGVEFDGSEGMCLFDDMNYVEITDEKIYVTSLYNFTQPLIRYELTDILKYKKEDNEKNSRYPFTMIESLVGRNEDILWFEDDNGKREFLHPLAIEGFCIEGLIDYQFKKIDNKTFEMIAQSSNEKIRKSIEKEMKIQMKRILDGKRLKYVNFQIRFVDEIMPDKKTGKKKLIIK